MSSKIENSPLYAIAVIGLGYVGLPLAIEFGKQYKVTGFDIDSFRVDELIGGNDHTREVAPADLKDYKRTSDGEKGVFFTSERCYLEHCNIFIITVPTPVDKYNNPDLSHIIDASILVGSALKKGDIVIYESTVFPGCTEEICVPILEKNSGLTFNSGFYCGYSPERINPGDNSRKLTNVKKVTSGSTEAIGRQIDRLYGSIILAGTHFAPSIKVAEAAKVIENAQRDINIAFVNELSKIFFLLDIDTNDVLDAAATKWNFLPFKPGLVGGHCIGVDPYYLAQKAISVGYYPEIILSGRRINNGMGGYIADAVVKLMVKKEIMVSGAAILILGITFKENCPDIRNTRVTDIIDELKQYKADIAVYDPWVNCVQVKQEYDIVCLDALPVERKYDAVIVAVCHSQFANLDFKALLKDTGVLYDVKGMLDKSLTDGRL